MHLRRNVVISGKTFIELKSFQQVINFFNFCFLKLFMTDQFSTWPFEIPTPIYRFSMPTGMVNFRFDRKHNHWSTKVMSPCFTIYIELDIKSYAYQLENRIGLNYTSNNNWNILEWHRYPRALVWPKAGLRTSNATWARPSHPFPLISTPFLQILIVCA